MTMKWWKTGCIGVIALMGLANVAAAGDAVFPGGSGIAYGQYGPITTGWQFTPTQDIVVTKLAFMHPAGFNMPNGVAQGLKESHPIAIWLASNPTTPVASGTIPAGAKPENPSQGGYVYINPNEGPVTLIAGSTYVIAAYWATATVNAPDPYLYSVGAGWSVDPLVNSGNLLHSMQDTGGSFVMPSTDVGTGYQLWSANFQIETNSAPIAEAGDNVTVRSDMQSVTVVTGTGTDSDGDSLEYQYTLARVAHADVGGKGRDAHQLRHDAPDAVEYAPVCWGQPGFPGGGDQCGRHPYHRHRSGL
jgi:hypothetical protein